MKILYITRENFPSSFKERDNTKYVQFLKIFIVDDIFAYCCIDKDFNATVFNHKAIAYSTIIQKTIEKFINHSIQLQFESFIFNTEDINDYRIYLATIVEELYNIKTNNLTCVYTSESFGYAKIRLNPGLILMYKDQGIFYDSEYNKITMRNASDTGALFNEIERQYSNIIAEKHDWLQKISKAYSIEELKDIEQMLSDVIELS